MQWRLMPLMSSVLSAAWEYNRDRLNSMRHLDRLLPLLAFFLLRFSAIASVPSQRRLTHRIAYSQSDLKAIGERARGLDCKDDFVSPTNPDDSGFSTVRLKASQAGKTILSDHYTRDGEVRGFRIGLAGDSGGTSSQCAHEPRAFPC